MSGILVRLLVALPAAALLYAAFDLADQGRRLARSAGWATALLVELLHLPLVMAQVLPAALLLSLVLWLSGRRTRGELEAIAALGGRATAIALSATLTAGLGCVGLSHLLAERIAPACEQVADRLISITGTPRPSPLTGLDRAQPWRRSGRWFVYRTAGSSSSEVLAVELDARQRIVQRVEGRLDRARGSAALAGVQRCRFDPEMNTPLVCERHASLRLPVLAQLQGTWSPLRAEARAAASLQHELRRRAAAGERRRADALVLHSRRAYPWVNLLVALAAVAAARGQRRRPVLRDLSRAVGYMIVLWSLLAGGWILGRGGLLSVGVAAWSPLLLGALVAALGLLPGGRSRSGTAW